MDRGSEVTLPVDGAPLPGAPEGQILCLLYDTEVTGGMCCSFEPCASIENDLTEAKVGGTVMVADTGVNMLNKLGKRCSGSNNLNYYQFYQTVMKEDSHGPEEI